VAQKTKSDVKKWHNETGYLYLKMAEEETDDERSMIKHMDYDRALNAFRLAGNQQMKKEVEQLLFEYKPKVKLTEYKVRASKKTVKGLKQLDEDAKKKANLLLKKTPEIIYSTIAAGHFFPTHEYCLKAVENKQRDFLDGWNMIYFDEHKNISTRNDDEKQKGELLEAYGTSLRYTVRFLYLIVVPGIRSGHLTYKNLILFLHKHTWIGKPHTKINLGGHEETLNWIPLIAPSICEFYNQVLASEKSDYYRPSYVLCIDSLAIKIEGLLRNFCERLNISPAISKRKGTQQANIEDLLSNENLYAYFNEDDRLFFRHVFSGEGGLNVRNKVAHTFFDPSDYHYSLMLLLIAVVLRIGKYDMKKKSEEGV